MTDKGFNDEALILKVKNWQTADKYAVCFSRGHGKISFLAYGARYARTNGGRLVQPFAVLDMNLPAKAGYFKKLRAYKLPVAV